MSTAELTYNLKDENDLKAFQRAIKSNDMALMLWDLYINRRAEVYNKIESLEVSEERLTGMYEGVTEVYELITDLLEQYNIRKEIL
jgi:hypothetical protein